MRFKLILILICLFYQVCFAHPVTYKDAFATSLVVSKNTDYYINRSISPKQAFGVRYLKLVNEDANFMFIQSNRLLKRWFFPDAQANIYSTVAIGLDDLDSSLLPCVRLYSDYENRLFYTAFEVEHMIKENYSITKSNYRIGLSPYKHSYKGVALWFILHLDYLSTATDPITFFPLIRSFYKSYLVELGSNGINSYLQVMLHF